MGTRSHTYDNQTLSSDRRMNQPSTAHMESGGRLSAALLNNSNARFAYDELVAVCADFLGSAVIDTTVTQFAENVLTLIESPTTLDSPEVKRRIEQILPVGPIYKHRRGMTITDRDCSRLCSLADRVINNAPYTNLNIVDENEEDLSTISRRKSSLHSNGNDVEYIRQIHQQQQHQQLELPEQLPSFVEPNFDIDRDLQYDMDVTPYDSENDEPIRMI